MPSRRTVLAATAGVTSALALGTDAQAGPLPHETRDGKLRAAAGWLMLVGTVLFCGSIYARTLGAAPGIVGVAPYGGVAFMVGWLAFAASPWLNER